jgi:hypothetical protein
MKIVQTARAQTERQGEGERQRMKKKRREGDLRRTVKSRSRRWKEGKNEEERVDGRYPKKIIRK